MFLLFCAVLWAASASTLVGNPPLQPSVQWRSGGGVPGAWATVSGATLVASDGSTLPVAPASDGSYPLPAGEWVAVIVHDPAAWSAGAVLVAAAPGAHAVLLPNGVTYAGGEPVVVGLVVEDDGSLTVKVFAE